MNPLRRLTPGRIAAWVALLAMLAVTLLPLWMVVKTALLPADSVFEQSATLLPANPTLDNFRRVLGVLTEEQSLALGGSGAELNFGLALWNSLRFTVIVVVLQTTCAAMAAYALARLRFPGRSILFALFVGSMMVPGVVT